MKLNTNTLSQALAMALMFSAAGLDSALAQTSAGDANTLDAVTVTGSRIRRAEAETAMPVITIDRQTIMDTGKPTIGDLLREMPVMAGFMPNVQLNSGFSHGRALVNMRNLGTQRVLVLVNGHRMAGPASSVASAPGVDVNAIPSAMVERVEILSGGVASVYGSDAISGVVNIILRDRYDGFALSADYGMSTYGDGNRRNLGAEWGKSWERGGIIVGASYNSMNPLYDFDRPFARRQERYRLGQVEEIRGSGTIATLKDGTRLTPNANMPTGQVSASDFHEFVDGVDGYNGYFGQYLITPVERSNIAARATFDFTPNIQGFVDYFWTRSDTTSQLTAYTMTVFANGGPDIPPFALPEVRAGVTSTILDNYYNPFGDDLDRYTMRSIDGQTRVYNAKMYQSNLVGGLRGMFPDTSWQWEVSAGSMRYKDTLTRTGFSIISEFQQAIGASFMDTDGVVKCGTPGNVIANCTPINVFNPNDPATVEAIRATQIPVGWVDNSNMKYAEATLDGTLFNLPAGEVKGAFGAIWRKNEFSQDNTSTVGTADINGRCNYMDGCLFEQSRDESIKEAFAELLIPLLSEVPGAQALNLNIGSRYSRYSVWGSTTNSKLALEWWPMKNLLIRASGADVFRAPALGDLYGSPFNGVEEGANIADPCATTTTGNPAACVNVPTDGSFENTGQTLIVTSGAANVGFDIQPESGRSYGMGLVYDPQWLPGLSLNADWWRVELDDMIQGTWYFEVISNCQQGDEKFCHLFDRDANGQLTQVRVPFAINLGNVDVRGYDFAIKYRLPETSFGALRLGLDATMMQSYRVAGIDHNYVGENSGRGNLPRWRATTGVNWEKGNWQAGWHMRYVGRTTLLSAFDQERFGGCGFDFNDADGNCVYFNVGSMFYHDLTINRKIESLRLTLSGGVNNVFDRDPPHFYGASNAANTDAGTYNTMGRYFWLRARVEF